ncbi:hypothetical protein TNCV_2948441 [Trichonephila clavipes]|nr:hypothetical protein TNCV_2948441 [Trichonephila clavipes]
MSSSLSATEGLMYFKSVVVQCPPVAWCGCLDRGYQLRHRSCHFTVKKNEESADHFETVRLRPRRRRHRKENTSHALRRTLLYWRIKIMRQKEFAKRFIYHRRIQRIPNLPKMSQEWLPKSPNWLCCQDLAKFRLNHYYNRNRSTCWTKPSRCDADLSSLDAEGNDGGDGTYLVAPLPVMIGGLCA